MDLPSDLVRHNCERRSMTENLVLVRVREHNLILKYGETYEGYFKLHNYI